MCFHAPADFMDSDFCKIRTLFLIGIPLHALHILFQSVRPGFRRDRAIEGLPEDPLPRLGSHRIISFVKRINIRAPMAGLFGAGCHLYRTD